MSIFDTSQLTPGGLWGIGQASQMMDYQREMRMKMDAMLSQSAVQAYAIIQSHHDDQLLLLCEEE